MITSYLQFINESIDHSNECSLYQFRDWDEFRTTMNEIGGWDNQTLFKTNKWRHDDKGRKILPDTYKEPNEKGCMYFGLKDKKDNFIGYTSLYNNNELVWIGDFEIFKNVNGRGYGRTFFNLIKDLFPNRQFELTFGSRNAMLFWQKLGFERENNKSKLMIYDKI